ncbi:hypothetical protein ScPMuIL_013412 [Solemya velum]
MELSKNRREKWLTRISRDIKASNLAYTRVCSDHFISGKPCSLQYADNPDWAPSLKLGHDKVSESSTACDSSRYQRRVGRVEQVKQINAASALISLQGAAYEDEGTVEDDTERGSQTDSHGTTIAAMKAEIQNLLLENRQMKQELSKERTRFDVEFFQ